MKKFTLEENSVTRRYSYLWRMMSDRWAWEYQRRDPNYREDAKDISPGDISEMTVCNNIKVYKSRVSQSVAERWGLIMMVDPNLNAIEANAVWTKLNESPGEISWRKTRKYHAEF